MCRRLMRDMWRGPPGADLTRMGVGGDPVLLELPSSGRGSHSHESGRWPGSVAGLCSRYHHASRLKAVYLTWRTRSHAHHVRYHHVELCPTWRMRT